jgi:hypothetical protein
MEETFQENAQKAGPNYHRKAVPIGHVLGKGFSKNPSPYSKDISFK